MRAIRSTCYPSADPATAITMVNLERDLGEPFEAALGRSREPVPGALVVVVTLTLPELTDLVTATIGAEAMRQAGLRREADMALCYHWYAQQLNRVTETGILSASLPAPLGTQDLREVLRQLAHHPNYRHQTIILIDQEANVSKMRDGVIS